jgi:hypothetical protein
LAIAASFGGDSANAVAPCRGPVELGSALAGCADPEIDKFGPLGRDAFAKNALVERELEILGADLRAGV